MSWLKLHRSIIASKQFFHPYDFKVWIWLLCKASTNDRNVTLKVGRGLHIVSLKVGDLIFGRKSAEKELGIDESTIYKVVQRLRDDGAISIVSNNHFSIISVTNYFDYQNTESVEDFEILEDGTAPEQQESQIRTSTGQQSDSHGTQLNNVKTLKKVEKVKKDLSPPASGGKMAKKNKPEKNTETRKHWQPLVDCWFTFYKSKFAGEEPSFTGKQIKEFSRLYDLLQLRAKKKMVEWSEAYAVGALNFYLGLAYSEEWLSKHFLLSHLVEQFDAVFAREATKKKGPAVLKLNDELQYIVDRYSEGELDDRLLTAELYKKMEEKKLIPEGYREKFNAPTPDGQKSLAIKSWLETNKKTTT